MGFSVAENPDAKRHDLSEFRVYSKALLRISMKSSCALSLNKRKRAKWLPTALSRPLERAPKSQNKLPEGHTTHRMHTCDPRAQPAITITKARPHSHDIHAATQELTDMSAHLQHSRHTRASHVGTNACIPPATPSVPTRAAQRHHVCAHH